MKNKKMINHLISSAEMTFTVFPSNVLFNLFYSFNLINTSPQKVASNRVSIYANCVMSVFCQQNFKFDSSRFFNNV